MSFNQMLYSKHFAKKHGVSEAVLNNFQRQSDIVEKIEKNAEKNFNNRLITSMGSGLTENKQTGVVVGLKDTRDYYLKRKNIGHGLKGLYARAWLKISRIHSKHPIEYYNTIVKQKSVRK